MVKADDKTALTFAQYLERERVSEVKHELIQGEMFAMAGGTPEHARLAAAVITRLGISLLGKPCALFSSDLRIRVSDTGLVAYPDAVVVCGSLERDPEDSSTILNPVVIVEVLSESTEAYDRGLKFAHYRRIASLKEFVLLSLQEPLIELFRRNEDNTWTLFEYRPPAKAILSSLGISIDVAEIYHDPFAPTPSAPSPQPAPNATQSNNPSNN